MKTLKYTILAATLLFVALTPLHRAAAAITFDNATTTTLGAGTTMNVTYVGSSCANRVLVIVPFAFNAGTPDSFSTSTYNGVALTQINKVQTNSGGPFIYMLYLLNPASGSNTLSLTFSQTQSSGNDLAIGEWCGILQSAQPSANSTASSTSANTLTDTFTNNTANSWDISGTEMPNGSANPTAGTGLTSRASKNTMAIGDSNAGLTAASHSFTWNYGATDRVAMVDATFKPAVSNRRIFPGIAR